MNETNKLIIAMIKCVIVIYFNHHLINYCIFENGKGCNALLINYIKKTTNLVTTLQCITLPVTVKSRYIKK